MTEAQYTLAALGAALLAVVVGAWVGSPKHRRNHGIVLGLLVSWLGVIIVSLIGGEAATDDERADARARSSTGLIVGVIGVIAVIGLFVLGSRAKPSTGSVEATVEQLVGESARCEVQGWMMLAGERVDVYGCDGRFSGGSLGCFAVVGRQVAEVTTQVKAIGQLGGDQFPCTNV